MFSEAINYEKQENYPEAQRLFAILAEHDTDYKHEILFHCGWCIECDPNSDTSEAHDYYRRAAELSHEVAFTMNSYFRLAWISMGIGDYMRATKELGHAIELGKKEHKNCDIYHHALYWYSVCLEHSGQYIDALAGYREVQVLSDALAMESKYREIVCLNNIGSYSDALKVCISVSPLPVHGSNERRFREIYSLIQTEREILEKILAEGILKNANKI